MQHLSVGEAEELAIALLQVVREARGATAAEQPAELSVEELPIVNWSTTGGDFRVAHFLGIHALQILPIAGWLIDRLKVLPRRAKPTALVAVSAGYVLLMGFVFMQAMNGVPLVRM